MPAPYSYDLRNKVITAIDKGMKKTEASQVFQVSRNTINLWIQRRKNTGDYKAQVGYQKGYGAKITDLEKFEQFASRNGSKTQKEMAHLWESDVSDQTISKALKKRMRSARISPKGRRFANAIRLSTELLFEIS